MSGSQTWPVMFLGSCCVEIKMVVPSFRRGIAPATRQHRPGSGQSQYYHRSGIQSGLFQPFNASMSDELRSGRETMPVANPAAATDLQGSARVEAATRGRSRRAGVLVMTIIPLDLERRFEQRWAARYGQGPRRKSIELKGK
jgi:hypothetical protein